MERFLDIVYYTSYTTVFLFVRDGIHSVADYNSIWMGVVVVLVVVLVLVVRFFTMG